MGHTKVFKEKVVNGNITSPRISPLIYKANLNEKDMEVNITCIN